MSTMLRLGPHDHGREMTYDEFLAGDYEEGFKYELIRGELYLSPQPNHGPTLRVHRRESGNQEWTAQDYAATNVYTMPLLPEFEQECVRRTPK